MPHYPAGITNNLFTATLQLSEAARVTSLAFPTKASVSTGISTKPGNSKRSELCLCLVINLVSGNILRQAGDQTSGSSRAGKGQHDKVQF